MIEITPLATTSVNWPAFGGGGSTILARQGIRFDDPAALPIFIKGDTDLQDHWSLQLVSLSFLIKIDKWKYTLMRLTQCYLTEDSLILHGSADIWRSQILAECKRGNDPARLTVFNRCYDYICRTSLRSMFTGITRSQNGETFFLS